MRASTILRSELPQTPRSVTNTTSRRSRWSAVGIVLIPAIMALAGCKTEKSPDNPTVLGTPAKTAYLGVEYYYNFGAYGGDAILDYSLTNAPPWLAMEDTSNKAREGIIIRGVPGVTGGNRGEADLGTTNDINLTATDGSRVGVQPFDIEVKQNMVTMSSEPFTEGARSEDVDGAGDDETCAMPPMEGNGLHQITYDTFNVDGSVKGTKTETLNTYPVIVRVQLAQPSVQTTKIAFELRSNFDPSNCDGGASSGQECEFSLRNREEAQLSKDVVLAGNMNNSDGKERLPQPGYVDVIDETSGVLTIDRGKTECFIRLEVVDDRFAEPTERFELALTEVRQGLVALGSDDEVKEPLSIVDNQPAVTFQSVTGQSATAVTEGSAQRVLAVLDRKEASPKASYKVRLTNDTDKATATDPDYEFLVSDGAEPPHFSLINELNFGAGVNTVEFFVHAVDDSSAPPASEDPAGDGPDNDDEYISVGVDSDYQDGRINYAAIEGNLKVWFNKMKDALTVGDESVGVVPSDIVVGDSGRIFVASSFKDSSSGKYDVGISIFNRFGGSPVQAFSVPANSDSRPEPKLAFIRTTVEAGAESRVRNALALTFATDGSIDGGSNKGGIDEAVYLFRRDAGDEDYVERWRGQFGTSGNDIPLYVGINSSNRVFIAGQTTGRWTGQTQGGGLDVYVQRIDTETNESVESPVVAWTSQQGSSSDDSLAGLGVMSSTAYLAGTTLGQIGSETPIGGRDLFISNYTGGANSSATIVQTGTDSDDSLNAATIVDSRVWMLGDGNFGYNSDAFYGDNNILEANDSGSSKKGYVLSYDVSGKFDAAITLNDSEDASNDSFTMIAPFDGDAIIGGFTDGSFVEGGTPGITLARVGREEFENEEEDEDNPDETVTYTLGKLKEEFRRQLPSAIGSKERVLKIAPYKDEKLAVLFSNEESGNRIYQIQLINGDGQLLTNR